MIPVSTPPGVVSTPTTGTKSVRWAAANLVRWSENGRMTPIKGQEKVGYNAPFESRVRAIHQWESNSGDQYTAYLCEGHLYVDIGGTLVDISPTPAISPPYSDVTSGGFGMGLHGAGRWGTPRPPRPREKKITPAYTLGNWGEDLLAMTSTDGRLLRWSPNIDGDPAEVVTEAPTNNRCFVVTSERYVILFGMGGDASTFGWCDQEDITNWNFANVSSRAGFFKVEPSSPIIAAKESPGGVIFFTALKPYQISYVGLPYVYGYDPLPGATAPISASSIVTSGNSTFWFSESGWWTFDGVSISQLPCDVWDFIETDINWTYSRYESFSVDLVSNSEIHTFFVSKDQRYNDKLIIYNYRDKWWSTGKMSRSCGFGSSYTSYPTMSDGDSVYLHEKGTSYPGVPEGPWAETHSLSPTNDGTFYTIKKMRPDFIGNTSRVAFRSKSAKVRGTKDNFLLGPRRFIKPNGNVDLRATGIEHRVLVESTSVSGEDWTLGNPLVDVVSRGKR